MLGSCFEFSSLTFGLFVLPFCLQRVVQSNHPCDCTILARFLLLKPHFSLPLNCLSTFFFSWLSHKSPFFYVLSLWWTEWRVSLVSLILLVLFFFSFVRSVYPGSQGQFSELPGCGLLRLHSTYRHDLKIYASDEGRVQMTAAAFAKVTIQKLRSKIWLLCRECQESESSQFKKHSKFNQKISLYYSQFFEVIDYSGATFRMKINKAIHFFAKTSESTN